MCLAITDVFALTGKVVDVKGAALQDVDVRLVGWNLSTRTDSRGLFALDSNPTAGIHKVLPLPGRIWSERYDILGRRPGADRREFAMAIEPSGRSQAGLPDTLVLEKSGFATKKLEVADRKADLGAIVLDSLPAWPPVIGTYMPDASTTGPRPGIALRRVDGDVRITTDGQIVENLDIYGRIIVTGTGTNAIVRNCIVRGPGRLDAWKSVTAVITGTSGKSLNGLRVEDTRIDLTGRENPWVDGIRESDVHLLRVEIKRTVDGISLVTRKGNVVVEGSWIHDGYYTEWAEGTPDYPSISDSRTHSDVVQFHLGRNYVFRGNRLGGVPHPASIKTLNPDTIAYKDAGDDYENACFMIKQEGSADSVNRLDSVLIEKNWILGGRASINLSYANNNTLKTFVIRDNVFPRSTWGKQNYILKDLAVEATIEGNMHPDGTPVVVGKGQ